MEKCRELGIKPGPIIGLLKRGNMITLEDGRDVHPHEVQFPDEDEIEYLVIDCPSEDYLGSLVQEPKLRAENLSKIQGIFHFSPGKVVENEKYSEWMNTFPDINHVMLNEASEGFGTVDGQKYNTQLNTVCPEVFSKMVAKEPGPKVDYEKVQGKVP